MPALKAQMRTFEVADTGTSMTDEIRAQYFNLFFSAQGSEAPALGLA